MQELRTETFNLITGRLLVKARRFRFRLKPRVRELFRKGAAFVLVFVSTRFGIVILLVYNILPCLTLTPSSQWSFDNTGAMGI